MCDFKLNLNKLGFCKWSRSLLILTSEWEQSILWVLSTRSHCYSVGWYQWYDFDGIISISKVLMLHCVVITMISFRLCDTYKLWMRFTIWNELKLLQNEITRRKVQGTGFEYIGSKKNVTSNRGSSRLFVL